MEDVRDAVRKYLVFPIEAALRAAAAAEASTSVDSRAGDVVQMPQETATERVDPFVVSLDALSRTEAERLAGTFQSSIHKSSGRQLTTGTTSSWRLGR